jgi:hypothetical protein
VAPKITKLQGYSSCSWFTCGTLSRMDRGSLRARASADKTELQIA